MKHRRAVVISTLFLPALIFAGCTHTLVSSWKAPDATPFQLRGEKVAAIVMSNDLPTRRAGEDALARQLSAHGAQGIPMYTLIANPDHDEAKARAAAEQAGVVGVVVMRPVRIDKELSSRPSHAGPVHHGFWGGYFDHGWDSAWSGEIRTDTIVTVETLVYALRENKLVWAGQSKTTNPRNLDRLIEDTAKQVTRELVDLDLMPKASERIVQEAKQ